MKLLCSRDMCYALLSVGLSRKFEAYLVYISLIWNKNPRPFTGLFTRSLKITPFYFYVAMFSPCHPQFSRANWWHAQSFFSSVKAAMFRDTVVVVAAVVRTRPRAIPLAMITMRKSIHGFPLISIYGMLRGLRYFWFSFKSEVFPSANWCIKK